MKEIETKIVDIDEKGLRKTLAKRAKFVGKFNMERYVFDMMPETTKEDEIIRVRTDGKRTMLTYKRRRASKSLTNTEEIEVEVGDLEKTKDIISKLWARLSLPKPYHQETILEKWLYKGTSVEIHTWPLVPPFVEVEGGSVRDVRNTIKELGIKGEELGNRPLYHVFARYGKAGLDAGDLYFDKGAGFGRKRG